MKIVLWLIGGFILYFFFFDEKEKPLRLLGTIEDAKEKLKSRAVLNAGSSGVPSLVLDRLSGLTVLEKLTLKTA